MGYVMHGSKGWWIAIGKQQWGQAYGYKSAKSTTLPISFTYQKFCEVVGATHESTFWETPASVKRNDSSLTTITTGVHGASSSTVLSVRFIALGV